MPTTEGSGLREWATRVVQWEAGRSGLKRGVQVAARVRGAALTATGTNIPQIANIYAAGSPKAGSQWMKHLFHHPLVRAETGLFTLPQLDYQMVRVRAFPPGTFVPGIYMSYPEFRDWPKPWSHRTVYMFRDPRELVVSGYFSATKTHRKVHIPELEVFREELRHLPIEEGLLRLIDQAAPRLREIETWVGVDDPTIATFRLEDIDHDPRAEVPRMLEHCGVFLKPEALETVLNDVSRDALQAADLAQRGDGQSHYRVDRSSFREIFGPEHYAAIEEIIPGLAKRLGYPD